MLIFAIIMPIVVLVVIGIIYGNKPAFDGADYTFLEQSFGGIAKNIKIAGVIASVLYFPMLIFSGATLPYEVMPKVMQQIVDVLPLTQGIKILKSATLGLPMDNGILPVIIMIMIAAFCSFIGIRFFKWE